MPHYVIDEICIICASAIKAVERFQLRNKRAKHPFGLAIHYLGEGNDEPLMQFYASEEARDGMFEKLGAALRQETIEESSMRSAHLEAMRKEGKAWE